MTTTPHATLGHDDVVVEPSFAAQREALSSRAAHGRGAALAGQPLETLRRDTRSALGLPTDRPLILAGHQAGIWHAGILAKWLLADRLAKATGGTALQLVVDQDVNDAGAIAYPALKDGSLTTALLPATPARRGGPTGLQPPIDLGAPTVAPVAEAAEGVEAIRAAMRAERGAPNLAAQTAAATMKLLGDRVAPMPTIAATSLLSTPVGQALLDEMRRHPARCAEAYNRALAADPHLARPLADGELPLWRIEAGNGARARVRADETGDTRSLAPRAFLMTALVRLAACDLFIHGTGGGRYERVTEAWIREWLGVELAPMSVATATLRLPLARYLSDTKALTRTELQRLRWDPDAGPSARGPSERKAGLLAAIAAAPRRSRARRDAYVALTKFVRERRDALAPALASAEALVASSRAAAAAQLVTTSRTWPWPLHAPAALDELARRVSAS
ncbi:MAG: hypothetical protein JNM94_05000 [Phycisphaerae bacterium]|nr:hypothetical protein [Phycisphaerae bacterium]